MEYPDNPVLKLRNLQLLLKKEGGLNNYYDSQIEQLPAKLEKEHENFLHYNKLLLSYHMYSINNSGLSLKPSVFESIRQNPQNDERYPSQLKYNQKVTDKYQEFFTYFYDNLSDFSKECIRLGKDKKEYLDILTFSIIPSFFAYLSSKTKIEQFISFMEYVFKYDKTFGNIFGRLLFVLPDFRFFFQKIISNLSIQVKTITKEQINSFSENFVSVFKNHVIFLPNIVKTIMEMSKNEEKFLQESFLIPAFTFLRQFGLIPYNSIIEDDVQKQLTKSILSKTADLVHIIKEAKSSTSLSTLCNISEDSLYSDSTYVLTYYDLLCINQMTDVTFSDGSHIEKVSNIGFPEPSDFSMFVLKYVMKGHHKKQKESVQINLIDELEGILRSLLKQVNVIPIGSEGQTIEDVIDKQTLLFSEDQRLRLSLKVVDLRKSIQRVVDEGENYSFDELIDLMEKKYEERDSERKKEVSRLSKLRAKIVSVRTFRNRLELFQKATLFNVFQYQLIEKWSKEKNPLSLLNNSIFQSSQNFVECFSKITDNFNKWLSSNGFQEFSEYSIVHNFVMSHIPLEKFIETHPELKKVDQLFYEKIRDTKDELLKNVCEDWMQPFLDNQNFSEPLLNIMNSFYMAKTPMEKLSSINELRRKADQIIMREGIAEVGADQQQPVVLLTIILSQPKHYVSNVKYIEYFYDNPRKVCNIVHEQQSEYSMTLISAFLVYESLKETTKDVVKNDTDNS